MRRFRDRQRRPQERKRGGARMFSSYQSIRALRGKGSLWERYPACRKPRNTIKSHHTTDLTQEIYWEGKIRERGCFCCGEEERGTGQKAGLPRISWDGGTGWPGIGALPGLILGQALGLMGFCDLILKLRD